MKKMPPPAKCAALVTAERLLASAYGIIPRDLFQEPEAEEYCGWKFTVNDLACRFRQGKVTPTKNGQFVTLYDRSPTTNKIVPVGTVDVTPSLFMVQCVEKDHIGHFMFPSTALQTNKIAASNGTGGKLAFRVYPPWVDVESKQAAAAQKWQCQYFIFDKDACNHKSTILSYLNGTTTTPANRISGEKRPRSEG